MLHKRQFSNPWRPKCSEGSYSGHEKRSGRCRALNATASMFDNFVWLPRTCVPGGVRSKKAIRTSLFLSDCARQRARSSRFHIQRPSGSSFPWQILALELIPSGSRPSNQLIATDKSYKKYGKFSLLVRVASSPHLATNRPFALIPTCLNGTSATLMPSCR